MRLRTSAITLLDSLKQGREKALVFDDGRLPGGDSCGEIRSSVKVEIRRGHLDGLARAVKLTRTFPEFVLSCDYGEVSHAEKEAVLHNTYDGIEAASHQSWLLDEEAGAVEN